MTTHGVTGSRAGRWAGLLREHAGLAVILLLFCAAGALRLNDLSLYTPDSSRYLIWGHSLAQGRGFVDATLPDPDPYVVHAPLYPLIIAPVEFFAPYGVAAVKAWTLCWGAAAIALFYLWLLRSYGKGWALGGAILLAANPLFGMYATEVLSDAPFIAALLAVFLLAERYAAAGGEARKVVPLLCAVVVAVMVREVGAAVVAAVVVWLASLKRYKGAIAVAAAAGACMAAWYIRNNILAATSAEYAGGNVSLLFRKVITGRDVPLVNEFALRAWMALTSYGSQIGGLIFAPMFSGRFGHLFFAPSALTTAVDNFFDGTSGIVEPAVIVAAAAGLVLDARSEHARLRFLFLGIYCAAVLLYPINDVRFLVPLLPFFIRWLLHAFRWTAGRFRAAAFLLNRRAALTALVLLMTPNLLSTFEMVKANVLYHTAPERFTADPDEDALYTSLYARPWSTLGAWITANTRAGELLVSPYKQLATVVGERKVYVLDKGATLTDFESVLRNYDAAYVVAPRRWGTIRVYEQLMIASRRFRFEKVHEVADLALYRVRSNFTDPAAAAADAPDDTAMTASSSLRRGWKSLAAGRTEEAHAAFLNAYARAPLQPEIVYYALVTYSLLGDSNHAVEFYHRLYGSPQAGSYLDPANSYLRVMNQLRDARARKDEAGVMVQSKEAAGVYWRLGASWQAASIVNKMLAIDSTYMFGLLWGVFYNLELGDTAKAEGFLEVAGRIDPPNPVVAAFRTLLASADTIRRTASAAEKARLHMVIARLYLKIELFEEAIDEGEMALGADPRDADALVFLGSMYERRGRRPRAAAFYREALRVDPGNIGAGIRLDSLARRVR